MDISAAAWQLIGELLGVIVESLPKLAASGLEAMKELVSKLPEALDEIKNAAGDIIDKFIDTIKNAFKRVKDVGYNLVSGIWEGIQSGISWFGDKVKDFGSGIVDTVKGVFKIHSPSQVFRDEIGRQLAAGIGLGFTDEMRAVADQMQSSIPTPEVAFSNAAAGMVNGVSTAVSGIGSAQPTTIILQTADGQALARWLLPDLRAASRANPEVAMA